MLEFVINIVKIRSQRGKFKHKAANRTDNRIVLIRSSGWQRGRGAAVEDAPPPNNLLHRLDPLCASTSLAVQNIATKAS